jgi:hypothetical protein
LRMKQLMQFLICAWPPNRRATENRNQNPNNQNGDNMGRTRHSQQRGIRGQFNFSVRDFLLILSLLGVGGNLYQCWQHSNEIEKLKKQVPQTRIEEKQHGAKSPESVRSANGSEHFP